MGELREALRDSFFVWFVGLLFLFMGVFGGVNCASWSSPNPPQVGNSTAPAVIDAETDRYNRQVAEIGKHAVVSPVWATPILIVGLVGFVSALGVVIYRNME